VLDKLVGPILKSGKEELRELISDCLTKGDEGSNILLGVPLGVRRNVNATIKARPLEFVIETANRFRIVVIQSRCSFTKEFGINIGLEDTTVRDDGAFAKDGMPKVEGLMSDSGAIPVLEFKAVGRIDFGGLEGDTFGVCIVASADLKREERDIENIAATNARGTAGLGSGVDIKVHGRVKGLVREWRWFRVGKGGKSSRDFGKVGGRRRRNTRGTTTTRKTTTSGATTSGASSGSKSTSSISKGSSHVGLSSGKLSENSSKVNGRGARSRGRSRTWGGG